MNAMSQIIMFFRSTFVFPSTIMVEIRLCNRPGSQIPFISVPPDDIRRLAIHPLKWLRFVLFAISGAQGHLATTPTGPPVDYTTPFDDLAGTYYYLPEGLAFLFVEILTHHFVGAIGQIMLVDHQALNDRVTSSDMTPRRHNFKGDVLDRDHHCIITQVYAIDCDAVHIIPKRKGDDVSQLGLFFFDSSPISPPSTSKMLFLFVLGSILLPTHCLHMLGLTMFEMACCCRRVCTQHLLVETSHL